MRVARDGERATLAPEAREEMRRARDVVERALRRGDAVYGLNTGVGVQKRFSVSPEDEVWFNRRLLDNHHVGMGPPAPDEVVRAALLRLVNGMAAGYPGVRPSWPTASSSCSTTARCPRVRLLGSLGQSDLAPNAEIAIAVFEVFDPAPGEALAVINNNSFATGFAALALADALRLLWASDAVGALALEAFAANAHALRPAVGEGTTLPRTPRRPAAAARAARGQLPAQARRGAQPAGPAHVSQHAAAAGRGARRLSARRGAARHRAQRGADQPARARRRGPGRLGGRVRGAAAGGGARLRAHRARAAAHQRHRADAQAARQALVRAGHRPRGPSQHRRERPVALRHHGRGHRRRGAAARPAGLVRARQLARARRASRTA